jgi:glycosyltransferase involved in cell wall biosynthesis
MRILHVTPYYEEAWAYGGIPRAASATARALAARGHDVTVCTTDACRPDARLSSASLRSSGRLDVRVFRNVSNAAAYHLQFFTPIGLNAYLRDHAREFDVAHVHGCHHLPGALAVRHLRQAGVPYVVTTHGTAPYLERRRLAKRVFDATVGRRFLEDAARVIAVSSAEREQLTRFGLPADSITVVPNPVDISDLGVFPGAFRRRLGLGAGAPIVLFLGKLTAQKRVDVLARAVAALGRAEVSLVIAGNDMGAGRPLRRLIHRLGIGHQVVFAGLLTGAERLCALADADVVVYPSAGEVFGLVPVEALLCGTPVIVSDDSGCGEVIREIGGGLRVPMGDTSALRDAIEVVLTDRATWRQAAAEARIRAQRFSSDRVGSLLDALYLDVTSGASPTSVAAR